eukprot:CAMPEP_0172899822 /NCGR_PEP_ID=MMETSP1075-20121228/162751_1 /TAXON_ID=2916 /ORGANISM="Ceratium fusus, Strain PA161109" /LENGTH=92 /DNA_ID=CAMNT_0013755889 /DNA_START=282 /DNA_END=561 /DNA_ORIENTATION=-
MKIAMSEQCSWTSLELEHAAAAAAASPVFDAAAAAEPVRFAQVNLGILGCIEPSVACGEAPGAPTAGTRSSSASCAPSCGENDGGGQHGREP